MRTEAEIREMIAELEAMRPEVTRLGDFHSHNRSDIARAIIAALENVLNGPRMSGECGCLGPAGLCLCQIRGLGLNRTDKQWP